MNQEQNFYTAVTIGPILDTMNLITKPAALWAASVMFSTISKRICVEAVNNHGIAPECIITPYYPGGTDDPNDFKTFYQRSDGIGLFHDHIIVRDGDQKFYEALPAIKEAVLKNIADQFKLEKEALAKYVMIAACVFDLPVGKNPILHCGDMLDCLELSKVFAPKEEQHPIIRALDNRSVKLAAKRLGVNLDEWQLTIKKEVQVKPGKESAKPETEEKDDVRDIPDIAKACKAPGYKKNKYYCILRADGDNVSQIISNLETTEDCRRFSRTCLSYCGKVADAVGRYGGVTVYAGGDDLFAIVPCEGAIGDKQGSVFELIQNITSIFNKSFDLYRKQIEEKNEKASEDEKAPLPTLSFGVFICYESFPLYEAVDHSAGLLFGTAKQTGKDKTPPIDKNCIAVRLQKHSGQSQALLISQDALGAFCKLLNVIRESKKEDVLLSAAQKVLLYEDLVNIAGPDAVENLFKNIFDADYHRDMSSDFVREELPEFYKNYCTPDLIRLCEQDVKKINRAKTLSQILRMMKFFVEKGAE